MPHDANAADAVYAARLDRIVKRRAPLSLSDLLRAGRTLLAVVDHPEVATDPADVPDDTEDGE